MLLRAILIIGMIGLSSNLALARTFALQFCNESNVDAYVALALKESEQDRYTIHGWWQVEKGKCRQLRSGLSFANYSTRYWGFWAHGFNGSNEAYWPTKAEGWTDFCISNQRYERLNRSGYKCSTNEKLRKFGLYQAKADGDPTIVTFKLQGQIEYGPPVVSSAPSSPSAADLLGSFAAGLALGNAITSSGGRGGGYSAPTPQGLTPRRSGISR